MSWQAHPGPYSSPCPAGESFAYDKIGNMTSKAGTTLNYGTTAPKHAVKSHGSTTYTYDANGSMTARGTQTIKYDPEQRPILVKDGASVHRASYDGDGVRRKREDGNGTVHYLGGYERKLAAGANPEAVTKHYSAGFGAISRPIAFRRGGTLHWVGSDHLGGTIRVLNSSFAALDGMRYKPYGEDQDTGTALVTDRKFTGQTEDETAGLYWYASRAYDPAIGRFVSPDTIVPAPGNPQALNRYSYVYNNPLKFVDPLGYNPKHWDQGWVERFEAAHPGREITEQDWRDYQFSLQHPGTGPNGSWTPQNWETYTRVRDKLGDLIEHIGKPSGLDFSKGTPWEDTPTISGPDETKISIVDGLPIIPGNNGITLGERIFMNTRDRAGNERDVAKFDIMRNRLIHEYVHVLQYREYGTLMLRSYMVPERAKPLLRGAQFAALVVPEPVKSLAPLVLGPVNSLTSLNTDALERQAFEIELIYWNNPWLPAPWEFPVDDN